jgi:neurofibromin 1
MLHEILEDMGFGGLWRSCSSLNGGSGGGTHEQQDRQCFLLTEKLIEVSAIPPSLRLPACFTV